MAGRGLFGSWAGPVPTANSTLSKFRKPESSELSRLILRSNLFQKPSILFFLNHPPQNVIHVHSDSTRCHAGTHDHPVGAALPQLRQRDGGRPSTYCADGRHTWGHMSTEQTFPTGISALAPVHPAVFCKL